MTEAESIHRQGVIAAMREAQRITDPEIDDEEFAELEHAAGETFEDQLKEFARIIAAYLAEVERLSP